MLNTSPFGSASHFANMGSWKAGSNTSNPRRLKAQVPGRESRQFFIASVVSVAWNHGANTERYHNKLPWSPQTKKSSQNFTVTGVSMSCLHRARTANFEYTKFIGEKSFKSVTGSQLKHPPWRCSSSIVIPDSISHRYWLSDLFMGWMFLQ